MVGLIGFTSCTTTPTEVAEAKPEEAPIRSAESTKQQTDDVARDYQAFEDSKIQYNLRYDDEFRQIFSLANRNMWEQAEALATEVYNRESAASGPLDPSVERIYRWVSKQSQIVRDQALEDKIRQIDSKNSVFSPSVKSFLTEQTDRGLPPRKDLRDAVQQIESTPYVPDSFNKTKMCPSPGKSYEISSESGCHRCSWPNQLFTSI
jgi:hypothetical protein